jgi:hypothetical protein
VTTKREPKITEEDTTIYANTLTNTNRQQTKTKMGQPPHEITNRGDFHTHRQIKIKENRQKHRPTWTGERHETKITKKNRTKLVARIFFHDRTHFKQS